MPDRYLDSLQASERASMWRRNIERPGCGQLTLVIEDGGGKVVGFASLGPEEGRPEEQATGELYAINLDPDAWRRGFGARLLRAAVALLRELGYAEAVLWVVPENARARGLYESRGWVPDGAVREDEVLGVTVADMRYRLSLVPSPPVAP
jgi:ribosomal protein S18 acetylase RimI-like enzyme